MGRKETRVVLFWLAVGGALAVLTMILPLRWAAAITIVCVPLAGTAVFMMGRDPILLPLVVTAGFAVRHAFSLLSKPLREQFLSLLSGDLLFVAFAAYAVVSGLLFPRLFAGQTTVFPQTGVTAVMLSPAQIAIVQIIYMLMGLYLYLALRHTVLRRGLEFLVAAILVQVALFAGFGFIQAIVGLGGVRIPTDWIVNNQGYALLTQERLGGFARVTSVFVEASSYAAWATGALAFCYGLFINRVLPRVTLALVILVATTMILSTSSTAYAGLAVIGLIATLYAVFDTDRARHERGFLIVLGGAFAAIGALVLVYSAQDGLLVGLREMVEQMTIHKGRSSSGIERGQWAQSAVQNALDTGLLGAGWGALRSSGLFHQLLGAVGVPGLTLFVLAIANLARRMFRKARTGESAVVCAGAFAMCCVLGAQAASGTELGVTNTFWLFAAVAASPVAQRAANRARLNAAREAHDAEMIEARGAERLT